MKQVVSFSGGRTSAYLVYLMEQKRKKCGWDVEYVFMDTGAEHKETYKFVKSVVENFDIKLTCLRTVVIPEMGKGCSYKVVDLNDCVNDCLLNLSMIVEGEIQKAMNHLHSRK